MVVKAVKEARAMKIFSRIEGFLGKGDVYDRDEIKEFLQQVRPA